MHLDLPTSLIGWLLLVNAAIATAERVIALLQRRLIRRKK
jgi:hypothetical protein